jgi:hypothetical protein
MPTIKLKINERAYEVDVSPWYHYWTRFAIALTLAARRKVVITGNAALVLFYVMVKGS